jgi:hypothetical protein
VLLIEPPGGDHVADNLNPTGRMFYAVSLLVCTPSALSQASTAPLGTLAGMPALREVAEAAGFRTVRRIEAGAAMNLLLELRP